MTFDDILAGARDLAGTYGKVKEAVDKQPAVTPTGATQLPPDRQQTPEPAKPGMMAGINKQVAWIVGGVVALAVLVFALRK